MQSFFKTLFFVLFLSVQAAFGQLYDFDYISVPKGVETLIYAEQKLINRNVDESLIVAPTITGQAEDFRPENRKWFKLKTVWVPEEELFVAELPSSSFTSNDFIKVENDKKYFKLIIHPESENFYASYLDSYERGQDLFATSTSSSRTLLATDRNGKFFFAKLSLDVNLGGVVRTIPRGEVARSVGMTKLTDLLNSPNENFKIMREPLGIIPKNLERGGQILREIPMEAFSEGKNLVPLFSLYSTASEAETLLQKMIRTQNDPVHFIEEKILKPFSKAWVDWAVDANLVMEAHAQNVLIQLDGAGLPTGKFYLRDLGGFNVKFDEAELKHFLPSFSTLAEDYHLLHSDNATVQSLKVYFEGGFVHNLNIEMSRLGYEVDLRKNFRKILIKDFEVKTGKRMRDIHPTNLYESLVEKVTKMRERVSPPLWGCMAAYSSKNIKNIQTSSPKKPQSFIRRILNYFN